MQLDQGPYPLHQFLSSLREVESVLKASANEPPSKESKKSMPLPWREVVHMARVAPALIECVRSCRSAVVDIMNSLPEVESETFGITHEELQNLSDYCSRIIRLAECGAGPENELIH